MPADLVELRWTMSATGLETLRKALRKERPPALHASCPFDQDLDDLDDYAHAAFEPLLLVSGTVASVCLVERIQDHIHSAGQNGLIIDTRGKRLTIREDHAVEHHRILVISRHGTQPLSSPSAVAIAAAIRVLPADFIAIRGPLLQ